MKKIFDSNISQISKRLSFDKKLTSLHKKTKNKALKRPTKGSSSCRKSARLHLKKSLGICK